MITYNKYKRLSHTAFSNLEEHKYEKDDDSKDITTRADNNCLDINCIIAI